jgi:cytochrome P450
VPFSGMILERLYFHTNCGTYAKNSPIGEQISLALLHDNLYPTFEALLAHEPVSCVPALKMWLVTRRDDVIAILKEPATRKGQQDGTTWQAF